MGALLLNNSGPAKGPKLFLSSNISRAKSWTSPYFMMLCQARASNHNLFHPQRIKRSPLSGDYIRSSDSIQPFLGEIFFAHLFFVLREIKFEGFCWSCVDALPWTFRTELNPRKKHLDGIWNTPFVLFSAYPGNTDDLNESVFKA